MRAMVLGITLVLSGCTGDAPYNPTKDNTVINDKDGDGFSSADGDCDDEDDTVYPGANDVVGDAIDQNCDLLDGVDADRDGQASMGSGGEDCNDDDPTIYDGAEETGWDGIDQDCNGDDQYDFSKVCAGKYHTCGLDTTGRIRCWGGDDYGQVGNRPLDARWKDLDCGYEFSCAVAEDGELTCWGRDEPGKNQVSTAPIDQQWDSVHVGHYHACAIDNEGDTTCWGADESGQVSDKPGGVPFLTMGLGRAHTCAITRGLKIIECWGNDGSDQVSRAPDPIYFDGFIQITSGANHGCAIRDDLGLTCWGLNNLGQTEAPSDAGPYSYIEAMYDWSCGVLEAERLSCWGINNQFQLKEAPLNGLESVFGVATGVDHGCAIRNNDGHVICWGKNDKGQTDVPWP